MNMTVTDAGAVRVLRPEGPRIDAAASIGFKDAVRGAVRGGPPRVVLDLGAIEFVDSSGLGAIIAAMKAMAPERRLEVADLQPNVARVFALTRMDQIFTIHPRAHEAQDAA